jgi:predicted component of type VI protein secretion system
MVWLQLNGSLLELRDPETVVGRGAQAGWRLLGIDLRARHFVVAASDGCWTIRPHTTADVVALNGWQLDSRPVPLSDGDVVAAGCGFFGFSLERPEPRDLRPATGAPPHLVIDAARCAHPLDHASTAIGSDPSNVIVLREPEAGLFHAEVRREAGGFALHPMGSSPTRLNGRPMTVPLLLNEGDEITIARTALRYTAQPLPAEIQLADTEAEQDDAALGLSNVRTVSFPEMPSAASESVLALALRPGRAVFTVTVLLVFVALAVAWIAY